MDALDVGYKDFDYNITDVNTEVRSNTILFEIKFNEAHQYRNGAGEGASCGSILGVEINGLNDDFSIIDIYMEEDDFYQYFIEQLAIPMVYCVEESVEDRVEGLIIELYELRNEMLDVQEKQVADERQIQMDIQPYAISCAYSGYTGAAYANKYWEEENPYFYVAPADCTNFVSQCVWAAYGGWYTSMSDSTLVSNISNKVRMTSTWYAGSGGGTSAWENVDSLWDYVVGNNGNGPKAYGYNNGYHYSLLEPIDIAVGDVLQKSSDGVDYTHSVYVIEIPGSSNPSYSEIIIAQHSTERKIALSESLATGGKYYRQIQFISNTFDK